MTLSFTQKWPKRIGELSGQPNYFIQKIWEGLVINRIIPKDTFDKWYDTVEEFGIDLNISVLPKLHSIRLDPHDRWRPGMKIHPVINNRTKNRFQFAPTIPCVSVQKIEIIHTELSAKKHNLPFVLIDDKNYLIPFEIEKLAHNDGFDSVHDFFQYFNEDFTGKIIHWTDLKY